MIEAPKTESMSHVASINTDMSALPDAQASGKVSQRTRSIRIGSPMIVIRASTA